MIEVIVTIWLLLALLISIFTWLVFKNNSLQDQADEFNRQAQKFNEEASRFNKQANLHPFDQDDLSY